MYLLKSVLWSNSTVTFCANAQGAASRVRVNVKVSNLTSGAVAWHVTLRFWPLKSEIVKDIVSALDGLQPMNEEDWKVLLGRISDAKCTLFLGAGVNVGILPLGGQIAREGAIEKKFPLRSRDDLAKVAQYIATDTDAMAPKKGMLELLRRAPKAYFSQPEERLDGLRALAELPFPVYLTTNYDDLRVVALRNAGKAASRELCRWHSGLKASPRCALWGERF